MKHNIIRLLCLTIYLFFALHANARDAVRNWYFDFTTRERSETYVYSVPDSEVTWTMTMRHKGSYQDDGDTFVSETWAPDPSDESKTVKMTMVWRSMGEYLVGKARSSDGVSAEGEMRMRITSPMTVEYEHVVEGRVVSNGHSRMHGDRVVAEENYYDGDGVLKMRAKAEMK